MIFEFKLRAHLLVNNGGIRNWITSEWEKVRKVLRMNFILIGEWTLHGFISKLGCSSYY